MTLLKCLPKPTSNDLNWIVACSLLLLLGQAGVCRGGVELQKSISRENPLLGETGKAMSVGLDGKVYVNSGIYLLRMNPDGTHKIGIQIGAGLNRVAVDARGNIAAPRTPHRGRHVALYNSKFEELGSVGGFLSDEHLNWASPSDVQVGESGDFYAMDQHHNRILQIALPGKVVAEYSLKPTGQDFVDTEPQLRVVESLKRFYIGGSSKIYALGFDGTLAWAIPAKVVDSEDVMDADDEGNLYLLNSETDTIKVYGPDGKTREPIPLKMDELSKGQRQQHYASLEMVGDEVFLKRHRGAHPTELFRVYNRQTGQLKRVIYGDAELVKAEFPSTTWTADESLPVNVKVIAKDKARRPIGRCELRGSTIPSGSRFRLWMAG